MKQMMTMVSWYHGPLVPPAPQIFKYADAVVCRSLPCQSQGSGSGASLKALKDSQAGGNQAEKSLKVRQGMSGVSKLRGWHHPTSISHLP